MLARVASFFRRFVSAPEPAEAPRKVTRKAKDRRVWVRYSANSQVKARVAAKADDERAPAVLRDVSLGGANLLLDMPLQRGRIIFVELQGDPRRTFAVQARIVRVAEEAGRKWSVGCVFCRELSADELIRFEAGKTAPSPEDKRRSLRYPVQHGATYRLFSDEDGEFRPARVVNLSAHGIRILVPALIDSDALLSMNLFDKAGAKVCAVVARVIYGMRRAQDDYVLGCHFIRELNADELESLL